MERFIATNHCEDRMDRMLFIAKHIGWGEIILRVYRPERDHIECLTDTGVLLVKSVDEKVLVTAYTCSVDKASALFHMRGMIMPTYLKQKIAKNEKIKKQKGFKN